MPCALIATRWPKKIFFDAKSGHKTPPPSSSSSSFGFRPPVEEEGRKSPLQHF